jgi:hypothetical protein
VGHGDNLLLLERLHTGGLLVVAVTVRKHCCAYHKLPHDALGSAQLADDAFPGTNQLYGFCMVQQCPAVDGNCWQPRRASGLAVWLTVTASGC